jgi:NTE family protein
MLNDEGDVILILSGGLGLGSYQAGAYQVLAKTPGLQVGWLAGSSVGAVNAALIAGSAPDEAVQALEKFWSAGDLWLPAVAWDGHFDHARNWINVIYTRIFGAFGHFRPRLWTGPFTPFRSFYDLRPMRERLEQLVDFGLLNSGHVRVSIAATDIESGEAVIFDTAKGDELTIDHILASCGFLPEFAPIEIDGRLLGDGGLSINAPIEAITRDGTAHADKLVIVVDLFAPDGPRPDSLEAALARKNDLLFANQTMQRLDAWNQAGRLKRVLYLSYRACDQEAGSEKTFDLSRRMVESRWASGAHDMEDAWATLQRDVRSPGIKLIRRGEPAEGQPAKRS